MPAERLPVLAGGRLRPCRGPAPFRCCSSRPSPSLPLPAPLPARPAMRRSSTLARALTTATRRRCAPTTPSPPTAHSTTLKWRSRAGGGTDSSVRPELIGVAVDLIGVAVRPLLGGPGVRPSHGPRCAAAAAAAAAIHACRRCWAPAAAAQCRPPLPLYLLPASSYRLLPLAFSPVRRHRLLQRRREAGPPARLGAP